MAEKVDRAVCFVDGNNFYHACTGIGLGGLMRLRYPRVCEKLAGPRTWVATRYYVGRVRQVGDHTLYANQRRFVEKLLAQDPRISVHFGRIEPRVADNAMARDVRAYLADPQTNVPASVRSALEGIAAKHAQASVMVEKAVDVQIAVDMVTMAQKNEYDTAYLMSADGDLTPAVRFAREAGKKVFVASPAQGAQLAKAANSYIRLPYEWFGDCF